MNSYCQLYFTLTSGCSSGGRLGSRRWPQIIFYNFPIPIPTPLSSSLPFFLFFSSFSFSAPYILLLSEAGWTLTRNDRSLDMSYLIVCCTLMTFPASSFKIIPTPKYMFLICITEKSCLFYSFRYLPLVQWIIYSVLEFSTTDSIWITTQSYYYIKILVKPGLLIAFDWGWFCLKVFGQESYSSPQIKSRDKFTAIGTGSFQWETKNNRRNIT